MGGLGFAGGLGAALLGGAAAGFVPGRAGGGAEVLTWLGGALLWLGLGLGAAGAGTSVAGGEGGSAATGLRLGAVPG
ncbi:MAG: hypothetical protein ACRDVE_05235, partial [Actinocrinis sp.]